MADIVDPTQTGKYPVVLSDRLLGRESNEIFTGVRYNHKPSSVADSTPTARLKPAGGSQSNYYDLSLLDSNGRTEYAFAGARTVGDGRYVLYFDPSRQVFVLDRMDSTFHMNLTRTPRNSDPDDLSRKYPHIDGSKSGGGSRNKDRDADAKGSTKQKPARAKSPPARKKEAPARKPEKKAPKAKDVNLALPQASKAAAAKPKAKPRSRPADDDEEEEEEEDVLLLEYPGGAPKSQNRDFSPAFPSVRRFDDFMDQRESEADDADGESLGDPEEEADFKLPSPVRHGQPEPDDDDDEEEPEMMDVDQPASPDAPDDTGSPNLEDDLEKDLEEAFEAVENSQKGTPAGGDESEISEED